jgi:drug/metabolite transporter (DMT)-like permease
MAKFEITKAYLFISLAPVLVFLLGLLFLNETFTFGKILGLINVGPIITVKH